jgi:hypothetical protein
VSQEKKPQLVWSGRPVGTYGHPHTVGNERLQRHEFGVSFFAQSQDEQDRAAIIWFLLLMQKKIGFFIVWRYSRFTQFIQSVSCASLIYNLVKKLN